MKCGKCGADNRDKAKYCKHCGEALAQGDALGAIVGLDDVKRQLRVIATMHRNLMARAAGAKVQLNTSIVITGQTGTGKTMLADTIRDWFHQNKIIAKQKLTLVDAVDYQRFVDDWDDRVKKAKGGVLFFDNVQKLLPDRYANHINPLDKLFVEMDHWEGDPVVVISGLAKGLDEFLESNPNVASRFKYRFDLPVPGPKELEAICRAKLQQKYAIDNLTPEAADRLARYFAYQTKTKDDTFGYAHVAVKEAEDIFTAYISREDAKAVEPRDIVGYVPEQQSLDDILQQMDQFVGMDGVRQEITSLASFISMQAQRGESTGVAGKHYVFTGSPGTGKTTIARVMAQMLQALGVLTTGQLVEADRSKLVAGYSGQTAIKTNELIDSAIGGVLFIDEAYTLRQGDNDSFGSEAIDTLLKRLEDDRGKFVCIVAGYTDQMHDFIESNPGLKSRFTQTIHFDDYDANQLSEIFMRMARRGHYTIDDDAAKAVHNLFQQLYLRRDKSFGNAREVRRVFDQTVERQSQRLVEHAAGGKVAQEEMYRLTLADLPGDAAKTQAKPLDQLLGEMDQLIGMRSVKNMVRRLAVQNIFMKQRAASGVGQVQQITLNFCLTGNPGTGKTTVARMMGQILHSMDILPTSTVVEASRATLVGKYMGETPKLVNKAIDKAMGGILFIDEAYTLTSGGDAYGQEAVDTLMKRMEDDRGKLVIIVAGYKQPMDEFMNANPGLNSRFTHRLHIDDYNEDELLAIYKQMAANQQYTLAPEAEYKLMDRIFQMVAAKDANFGNAREMRTLLDATIQQLSQRVASMPKASLTPDDYQRITADDIPDS